MVDTGTVATARPHELLRVVAVGAADDHDHVAGARQLARGVLMLLGRPADRVDEADLRSREPLADEPHEVLHPFDRLRRLSRDSDPRMFLEVHDVLFVQHHVEAVEVLSDRPHLHVRALADDHRMIALPHQQRHGAVRRVNERTGPLDDIQTERASPLERALGGAVRGHHHAGRLHVREIASDRDSLCLEILEHDRIVDEIAEDGQGAGFASLHRQRNRVPHAKAHA